MSSVGVAECSLQVGPILFSNNNEWHCSLTVVIGMDVSAEDCRKRIGVIGKRSSKLIKPGINGLRDNCAPRIGLYLDSGNTKLRKSRGES